jgi:hypothetical protein
LQQRIPLARLLGVARVEGFRLVFNKTGYIDGSGKANIVPGEGSVFFAIYGMTADDKSILDRIEGLGKGYEEREIECNGFGRCTTYQAAASAVDDSLSALDWYKEIVLLGARYHGLPEDYIAAIERVPSVPDQDNDRNRIHFSLIEEMRRERRP